jgi:putative transposase
MSQTYTRLLYHVVFSTKDRAPSITDALKPNMHAYMGGIIKRLGGIPISIGGVEDHVHVLASIPPTISVSDFMRDLKAGSSKWVRDQSPNRSDFEWQRGYAAFTMNQSIVDDVIRYIDRQEEHHSKVGSVDELKRLLELNRAEFDPRFLA